MGTVKLADSELQRKCYENEVPVQKYYETSMWDNLNIMPFSSILINIKKQNEVWMALINTAKDNSVS